MRGVHFHARVVVCGIIGVGGSGASCHCAVGEVRARSTALLLLSWDCADVGAYVEFCV